MKLEVAGSEMESKVMDHHGLVSAMCQDLKLADRLNDRIGSADPRRVIQPGLAVVAMIINGLGFTNRRLYLTPQFFQSKAMEHLFDEEVTADNFDDHTLGKALDEIAAYGSTKLFAEVAFEIAHEHGLLGEKAHHDTTSFSLTGRYENSSEEDGEVIEVTHGYSKDHRPDLKQVMLGLTMTGKANLPIWMEPQSGNSSDKKTFNESIKRIKEFQSQLKDEHDFMWVADSALYSATHLLNHNNYRWISRVPESISEAKMLLELEEESLKWTACEKGYQYTSQPSEYGDIKQRWLLVFSKQAYDREKKTFDKRLAKQKSELTKLCWHLENQTFNCEKDALSAVKPLKKKFRHFNLNTSILAATKYGSKGRPKKGAPKTIAGYKIVVKIEENVELTERFLRRKGRFILATNDLDEVRLPEHKILSNYKEQQCVEDGFKFLKDPWFMVDSFYLKKPQRIEGLMMVMTLCLLVYNFAQHKLRSALSENKETIPNQKGKPTATPTMKWVFLLFEGVSIVTLAEQVVESIRHIITNLSDLRKKIIRLLGRTACKIYGINMEIAGM